MGLPWCPLVDRAAGGWGWGSMVWQSMPPSSLYPFLSYHYTTSVNRNKNKVMETKILLVLEQNWTKQF